MATSSLLNTPDEPLDPRDQHGRKGPSDSSDSGSDLAGLPADADTDSDMAHTGERPSVDPEEEERTGADVLPDEVVDEERLARSRPGDDEEDATRRRAAEPGGRIKGR